MSLKTTKVAHQLVTTRGTRIPSAGRIDPGPTKHKHLVPDVDILNGWPSIIATKAKLMEDNSLPTKEEKNLLSSLLNRMSGSTSDSNTEPAKAVLIISDPIIRDLWEEKLIACGVPQEVFLVIRDPSDFDPKDKNIALVLFDANSGPLFDSIKKAKRDDVVCTLIGEYKTEYRYSQTKKTVARINQNETPKVLNHILHEQLMDLIPARFSSGEVNPLAVFKH